MGIRPHDEQSLQRPISPEPPHGKHSFGLGMWQKLHDFFSKDERPEGQVSDPETLSWPDQPPPQSKRNWSARRVGVGLPRQATFRRQNSEKRDRLCPVLPCSEERRAVSHSRQVSVSVPRMRANSTPATYTPARTSAPAIAITSRVDDTEHNLDIFLAPEDPDLPDVVSRQLDDNANRPPRPSSPTSSVNTADDQPAIVDDKAQINAELDTRWILNLSMHFRDKSDREKFFVTYAETPNKWRRVTISCDYRNAEPGSLEMDLKELQFQRDKSLQIYESIRDSLLEIQFYDTVTNLKLETSDGRLHVHVTEDTNEIIPYPPRSTVAHLLRDPEYQPQQIRESDLTFESHLSGFVYKVNHEGKTYIKKEIPGPDTVDEFLYEINALHALHDSEHVIRLEAIVVDDAEELVKGLLISYAEKGAIVDLLYDFRGRIPWDERLQWARDAVLGLSEIHEAGYVQGDFTLSNIVVDGDGNAKIIDINRRGCPVGWEPPEIATKIESHQRISMYIGEKTDIFQLGMTLWGLAADDDEPERHDPPLCADDLPDEIPTWYKAIVDICLRPKPRDRLSAKELAKMFPHSNEASHQTLPASPPMLAVRTQKKYIDPSQAVERDDIEKFNREYQHQDLPYSPHSSKFDDTFTYPRSSNYDRVSDISAFEQPRGRRPPTNFEHLDHRERQHWSTEDGLPPSIDEDDAQILSISPEGEPEYEEIDLDGKPFLIARNTFSDEELQILERQVQGLSDSAIGQSEVLTASEETHEPRPQPARHVRPPFHSRTSGTSSSTPRNSQIFMPQTSVSNENHIERSGPPFSRIAFKTYSDMEDDRLENENRESLSPQPPPSLTYADSGFHEPLSLTEEEHRFEPPLDTHNTETVADLDSTLPVAEKVFTPHNVSAAELQEPDPPKSKFEETGRSEASGQLPLPESMTQDEKSEPNIQTSNQMAIEVVDQCSERCHEEQRVVEMKATDPT